jgi:fatty aldehyde-generating acyl-ACP reductase
MLPFVTAGRCPWFSFIVHPRNFDDLCRFSSATFLRRYSRNDEEFQRKVCAVSPLIIGELIFGLSAFRGELISVTRMPEEMTGNAARNAVADAVELAATRGAGVVGLGALTSPATGGGASLVRNLSSKIVLTNGNAYTAAVAAHNVEEASKYLGAGITARVAIVGCTGSVGVPTTKILAEKGFPLILVGRHIERVQAMFPELAGQALCASGLSALSEADIILLLTNDASAQLTAALPLKRSVIIDCAQPANVTPAAARELASKGICVVKGGLVHIPRFASTYDFGLVESQCTFACLAETYLFAKEGIREHSTGRPTVNLAYRLERAALRHGVYPQPLFS